MERLENLSDEVRIKGAHACKDQGCHPFISHFLHHTILNTNLCASKQIQLVTNSIILMSVLTLDLSPSCVLLHIGQRIFYSSTLSIASSSAFSQDFPRPLKLFLTFSVQFFSGLPLIFLPSIIHSGHFYSAFSSPLLLGGAPDYSTDTVSEFHDEAHRQL